MPELSVKNLWLLFKGQYITAETIAKEFNTSFDVAVTFLQDCSIQIPAKVLLIDAFYHRPATYWVIDTQFHTDYFEGKPWLGGKK